MAYGDVPKVPKYTLANGAFKAKDINRNNVKYIL